MPEHIRSLIVILVFAIIFFAVALQPASTITTVENFTRRRNVWFVLTLAAFLANSFWIYSFIAIPLLIYINRHESNPASLYFSILFVIPMATTPVPGFGPINYLFLISNVRVLALFILIPALITLTHQSDNPSFGRALSERILAAYLLLTAILYLRETSLTDSLRQTFYIFIDAFLPYYVVSRSLKDIQDFRDVLLSLLLGIMLLAPIAVFESFKHWLLYSSVPAALEMEGGMTNYRGRDGILRAMASAGHPIVLGYLMVIGIGLYLFLQRYIQKRFVRRFGMALMTAGLVASLSRGPWLGASVLLVVFIITGRYAARRLVSLSLAAIIALSLVSVFPVGEKVVDMLPIIGSTDEGTISYREKLITNSMIVIQRNLWFGSVDYLNTPEMKSMVQGEGIVDIVNTYIGIALESGLVGLGLFVTFFVLTLQGIFRAMRSIPDKDGEYYLLGRALLATLLAILIIIFAASDVLFVPIIYWSVAGMGMAYTQMVRRYVANSVESKSSGKQPFARPRPVSGMV